MKAQIYKSGIFTFLILVNCLSDIERLPTEYVWFSKISSARIFNSDTIFQISGSITGLNSSGLILQNNGSDNLSISSGSTSFVFPSKISGAFSVTILTQPTGLICAVTNGVGVASSNLTSININCVSDGSIISGSISGLSASGLILQNNGANNLSVASGSTSFAFPIKVSGVYSVTVLTQPTGLMCVITNGTGTAPIINNIGIICSSDGSSWTARVMPSSANWYSVAFGNGVFAAVTLSSPTAASADCNTWNLGTMPIGNVVAVTYGNGIFVAIGQGGSNAATSTDGINWTARTLSSTGQWNAVTYGNGLFVAVKGSSSIASTSPDGINWTDRTLPSSLNWTSVAYGNGVFVAITQSSTVAASSTDGINWTARTMPSAAWWYAVTYGNGIFVAVTLSSNSAATSTDGINWTARTLSSSGNWVSVVYGNGIFVAIAQSSANASTSTDGITWTARTLASSPQWWSIAFGNGIFCTVAAGPSTGSNSSP